MSAKPTLKLPALSPLQDSWTSQLLNNLPALQETWVQSLGWEDPLEKATATPLVFWLREFRGLYSPRGCKESDTTEQLSLADESWRVE